MKKKIAIIGGSGFIGTRLVKRLLDAKHDVRIIDKRKSDFYPELWEYADVRDYDSLAGSLKGCTAIFNLAAEHKDNITPVTLYDDVNVGGAENVCRAAAEHGIRKLVFSSSVAVYGFAPLNTDETGAYAPFNDYGRTKMLSEGVYRKWLSGEKSRSLSIIRLTVVFGERNRGNVHNLLRQIVSGRFVMIGNGKNIKSIAYVENVAAFLEFALGFGRGEHLYNYIDKPDFDMNGLVAVVNGLLNRRPGRIRIPYAAGLLGGIFFDAVSALTGREFAVSAIRVKKFCRDTQFAASALTGTSFVPPVTLREGLERTIRYEFMEKRSVDDLSFDTE